jgi:hypothetical protein
MLCRSADEAFAAGYRDAQDDPPLTQAQADRVAVILAPYMPAILATRETGNDAT